VSLCVGVAGFIPLLGIFRGLSPYQLVPVFSGLHGPPLLDRFSRSGDPRAKSPLSCFGGRHGLLGPSSTAQGERSAFSCGPRAVRVADPGPALPSEPVAWGLMKPATRRALSPDPGSPAAPWWWPRPTKGMYQLT